MRRGIQSVMVSAMLIALAVQLLAATTPSRRNLKPMLSCDTYSLRSLYAEKKLTHETVFALMKELGIPGVTLNDIWFESYEKPYLDRLKAASAASGVKITGMIAEGNLATLDEAARRKQIGVDAMKIRTAAYLGAPVIRLNIGGTGNEETDKTVGVQRVIAAFKELLPLAKSLNVKLTIENHGGVSKRADQILEIIKGTDPQWVGACLDFGNWPSEDRYTESAKLAPYAYHTHMKCHEFGPDGEDTNKDYGRLLGYLRQADYKYAVSIEFEGGGDQLDGVKKSRDLILKHWPELRQQ